MQPDTENLEDRIDRDRRQRERELYDLLLLLLATGRDNVSNRVDAALMLGSSPYAAAADVLGGNIALGMRSPWPRVAAKLAASDVSGFARTVRVIGDASEITGYTPTIDYGQMARLALAKLLQHTQTAISDGTRRAVLDGSSVRRGVDDGFVRAGLVESGTSKAWLLDTTAVTLTGFAWSGGWFNGWSRPAVTARLKGFRFSAVLDERTTDVCRACDGTKVPVDSPWIQTRTPPLHFNCRSVLLPIFRDFEVTEPLPWTPWPAAGFGQAPAISAGIRFVPAA